ncbi:PD-(D/E)XK nuclease family protein [uncultured Planktosalinus sp.]|uniref:PD-(D/E)XK nuclease family protein n=1 Tax=uncultured Planktosalinus sp. TaxID=1810935 RepID=UPI0030DDC909
MVTYIQEIVSDFLKCNKELSTTIFILPSKRAGNFLKTELHNQNQSTQFSPEILSIEEFVEKIADLKIAESIELLFEFYEAYLKNDQIKEKEEFDTFSSWASVLIDDFNEIDRNLIPHKEFFNYLNSIKEIDHWYLNQEKTQLIQNYLSFWNSLEELYEIFTAKTRENGYAHQGFVYREAARNIQHYITAKQHFQHVFIGFNALNKSEEFIIKEILETGTNQIYWNAEKYFMEKPHHSASLFLKEFKNTWKYFKTKPFNTVFDNYSKPKEFKILGCSKNIGQVKCVSDILSSLSKEKIESTALVLADENLLLPVLNSLPNNIKAVNVTMGMSLKSLPATAFFKNLLKIHQFEQKKYYYKDVLQILSHPLGKLLLPESSNAINNKLQTQNLTQISFEEIKKTALTNELNFIDALFSPKFNDVLGVIESAKLVILQIKKIAKTDLILLETLFRLYEVWNKLQTLNSKYKHISTTKTLYSLFKEIIGVTSIDFKGEPYKGLQIMGLLETRALDFENIILVSLNEGILPAGKRNKSFITYDLKVEYKLPTHREKDAVYTYHFYSLLHRANTIHLLYNNQAGGLNAGEKSRFLHQIGYESPAAHKIQEIVYTPKVIIPTNELKQIKKTVRVIEKLKKLAAHGFSPSALTTYIRNPIDFYDRYILDIKDKEEVEETVAANTLGTIVHDALQHLFEPYINKKLTNKCILEVQQKVEKQVKIEFENTYKEGLISSGKNYIIYEISKRYINNFLSQELEQINSGNELTITHIENLLETQLEIPEIEFPVKIRGKVDRIDRINEITRIIDYKTGKVEQKDLNLIDWGELMKDDKHSKKIQVLTYALLAKEQTGLQNAQAGIISFKNLSSGFMPFTKKETSRANGNDFINEETLTLFKAQLSTLICEICNPEIPFIEKEIPENAF